MMWIVDGCIKIIIERSRYEYECTMCVQAQVCVTLHKKNAQNRRAFFARCFFVSIHFWFRIVGSHSWRVELTQIDRHYCRQSAIQTLSVCSPCVRVCVCESRQWRNGLLLLFFVLLLLSLSVNCLSFTLFVHTLNLLTYLNDFIEMWLLNNQKRLIRLTLVKWARRR